GAAGRADPPALLAARAVIAETGHSPAEGLGALVEVRAACVVLEARQGAAAAGLKLALEQDVADHPPLTGHCVERKQPDAGQLVAALVAVEAPEKLIAAAHGEQRGAAVDRGM